VYHDAVFTMNVRIDGRWHSSRTLLLKVIDPDSKK
jgi:hypothetical protein